MVIVDGTADTRRKARALAGVSSHLPHTLGEGARTGLAEIFAWEDGTLATHHIEQDGGLGQLAGLVGQVLRKVLCAKAPRLVEVFGARVLAVGEEQVDTQSLRERIFGEMPRQLRQHGHAAAAVIGAVDGLFVVFGVGVLVGPGARVVVRQQQDALGGAGVEASQDVAHGHRAPAVVVDGGRLHDDSVGTGSAQGRVNPGGAVCVGRRAGHAGPELHLRAHVGKGRIAVEGGQSLVLCRRVGAGSRGHARAARHRRKHRGAQYGVG